MTLRSRIAMCAAIVLGICSSVSRAEDTAPPNQPAKTAEPEIFKIRVGGQIPFHVIDFASGEHHGHCGCPSVMIKNHQARGLLVWSKEADDAALALVQAAEKWLDGGSKQAFFVVFDAEETALRKRLEQTPLKRATAGIARHNSQQQFRNYEIDKSAAHWVFLVDRDEVKSLWTLQAGKLTKEKQQEILTAAEQHFAAK